LAHTVVGFYAEQRQVGGLPAHERSLLAGLGSVQVDAELLVVRQAHQEPAVVAHLAIFSDLEAQLLGVELKRLSLAAAKQFDQRDRFHKVLSSFSSPGGGAATCCHPGYLLFGRVRALEAGAFNGWAPLFNRHRTPRLLPAGVSAGDHPEAARATPQRAAPLGSCRPGKRLRAANPGADQLAGLFARSGRACTTPPSQRASTAGAFREVRRCSTGASAARCARRR